MPPDPGPTSDAQQPRHAPAPLLDERAGRVVQLADPGWCWSRLAGARRGVLTLDGVVGSAGLHVDFTMDDLQVLIPVPAKDKVLRRMADLDVTLSLAGRADDGLRWVVRVTGVALLFAVPSGSGGGEPTRAVQPGRAAAIPLNHSLLLPVERLRGYQESRLAAGSGASVTALAAR